MKLRPSSFPGLASCPRFESGAGNQDIKDAGSDRHMALGDAFRGDTTMLDLLPDDDREGVLWALEYIRCHAPLNDYPIYFERKISFTYGEWDDQCTGTMDADCGPHLFDLKWRDRDYTAQMAAYARAKFEQEKWPEITVHVLYGAFRRYHRYKLTPEAAIAITDGIIAKAGKSAPTPCSYCSWCENMLTCPAYIEAQQAIVAGRWDWKLENFHASEITKPEQMAKALTIARAILKWCDAVEHHAKEMGRNGQQLPGFEWKEKQGKAEVADIAGAFQQSGLEQDKFLSCCSVVLTKLYDTYAEANGTPKATAKRTLSKRLESFIQRKPSTQYWKSVTEKESD